MNGTACVPCLGNAVSISGVCEVCFGNANADHTACRDCPLNQVAAVNATGCVCAFGQYNRSQMGIVTCTDNEFSEDTFDTEPAYAIPRDQVLNDLQCIECPLCLDCTSSFARLYPGFQQTELALAQTPTTLVNKSFIRCRPETAHMDGLSTEDGTGYDALEMLCTGGGVLEGVAPVPASCRAGHTGTLCRNCEAGYGRSGEDDCQPCDDDAALVDVTKFVGLLLLIGLCVCLVLIAVSFAIGDVYEVVTDDGAGMGVVSNPLQGSVVDSPKDDPNRPSQFPQVGDQLQQTVSIAAIVRTSKRLLLSSMALAVQPIKILISYGQVVGHVGHVLHFQFPPRWASVLVAMRPLVANIRGFINLECAGLSDFYGTWLLEVVAIPLTMLAFLGGCYIYRRQFQGAVIALGKFFSESFFLLFIIYPFVSNK